jgi:archaellum component FlaG (FlaF/FlaG flagellin family)
MNIKNSGSIVFLLTLLIFAVSICVISYRYTIRFDKMDDEFKVRDKNLIHYSDTTQKSNITTNESTEKQLMFETINQVKYFNEILNREQKDTMSYIVYVIAFFSIVAGFFGYKTINDIRGSLKDESKNITSFYEKTFSLLNEQASISKNFYELQYKVLEEKMNGYKTDLEKLVERSTEIETKVNRKIEKDKMETHEMTKIITDKIKPDAFEEDKP